MLGTISPLRRHHYETFYFLHVVLVPLVLVMSALHHPPIWHWCWVALGLWVCERLWRLVRWTRINGVFGLPNVPPQVGDPRWSDTTLTNAPAHPINGITPYTLKESATFPFPSDTASSVDSPTRQEGPASRGQYPPTPFSPATPRDAHGKTLSMISDASSTDLLHSPSSAFVSAPLPASQLTYAPPPGFAHAELLAGHSIRLVFTPARPFTWAAGQHFLVLIPHISSILTHPFTAGTCYDADLPGQEGALVFLIRAKAGWTRDLWNTVAGLANRGQHIPPDEKLPGGWLAPKRGVVMRMMVDGPFGSSARARWDNYSTAVIYAGGSGVTFGLSVMQHLCMRMAGRDGKSMGVSGKGNLQMTRVRFVWLVREYCK
jgi:hypothetical protein